MATTAQIEAIIDAKLADYPTNTDINSFWLITNAEFGKMKLQCYWPSLCINILTMKHSMPLTCVTLRQFSSCKLASCFSKSVPSVLSTPSESPSRPDPTNQCAYTLF